MKRLAALFVLAGLAACGGGGALVATVDGSGNATVNLGALSVLVLAVTP